MPSRPLRLAESGRTGRNNKGFNRSRLERGGFGVVGPVLQEVSGRRRGPFKPSGRNGVT